MALQRLCTRQHQYDVNSGVYGLLRQAPRDEIWCSHKFAEPAMHCDAGA